MKRGYSRFEVSEMGFNRRAYAFPVEPGSATGTLVMKEWSKHRCLVCYFDLDSGEKLILCVWKEEDEERSYKPRHSDLDLSYVELGTRLEISYGITSSGKSSFLEAEVLEE